MIIKKKITAKKFSISVLLCLAMASCGVPMEARNSAKVLSAYTVQIQKEAEDFGKFRLELAKERYANINFLESDAIEIENTNALKRDLWNTNNIGKPEKLEQDVRGALYDFIHDKAQDYYFSYIESKSRADAQNKVVSDMKSAVDIKSKDLHQAAESLSELSKEPDLKTQLVFFAGFAKGVNDSVNKLKQDAEKQANKGKDEVKKNKSKAEGEKEDIRGRMGDNE